jgi:hypothetical protein
MSEIRIDLSPDRSSRIKLVPYSADIRLTHLTVGLDNIHYDVFLSPRFIDVSSKYLFDMVRQNINFTLEYDNQRKPGSPEHAAFRKVLTEVLQESLTRAKFQKSIETDILHRLALLKFLIQELSNQFSSFVVGCKDRIRVKGELFEHSEKAHVWRSKIAELQGDRKKILHQIGETLCRIWDEVEDGIFSKSRRALFGEEFHEMYDLLQNRFLFVESGNDEQLFLDHYVLLGTFVNDPDRFDIFDALLLDFLSEVVLAEDNAEELSKARKSSERLLEQARVLRSELARLEEEQEELISRGEGRNDGFARLFQRKAGATAESQSELDDLGRKFASRGKSLEDLAPQIGASKQRVEFLTDEYKSRLGDYLNEPANARRLFDAQARSDEREPTPETRTRLLEEWVHRLEERDLLFHVLAGYELRKLSSSYCPPIHLQQLKKALVNREEARRVEQILEQFPARKTSMRKLDEASRSIRRRSHKETLGVGLQFAEDLMRIRRDRRNYQLVAAWMERITLVRSERSRELSRANKTLYEFLHPSEGRPAEDPIINHVIIKVDVRGSTGITKDLLARGFNPASHFSINLHEPVKHMLERYAAAKVFIEGDAIILAIYENESTRATQRAVARACVLAREILVVTESYNARTRLTDLPPLELGVGVAFQDSAPSLSMDGDSRIMISRALNLSDRLSSCSRIAKRLFQANPSPFNVYLLQTLMDGSDTEEGEDLLIRYNLNGIELNEEGFEKLSAEISLAPIVCNFAMPWGKERVHLYFGEVPLGGSLELIVIRKGFARQLLPGGTIGSQGTRAYYEICTDEKLRDLARKKLVATAKG